MSVASPSHIISTRAIKEVGSMNQIVLHILSGDIWGGSEAQMLYQLCELRKADCDARALFFNAGLTAQRYLEAGIPCFVAKESLGSRALVAATCRIVREIQPAILVTHGYKENIIGFAAALRYGIPLVSTFHGARETYRGLAGMKMAICWFVHRLISAISSKRLIFVCKALASAVGFARAAKVEIVYNVIPAAGENSETPSDFKNETAFFPFGRPAVVSVGRLSRVKRYDIAIQAIAELRGSNLLPHLYIVGEGPIRAQLEGLIKDCQLSDRVHLLGFSDKASRIIQSADALLITSDHEGLPTVMLEAISTFTPIIATNVGGIPEVLAFFPDYPAKLIRAGDPKEAAQAIEMLLQQDRTLIDREAIKLTLVKNFSPSAAAKRHLEIYSQILSAR